MAKLYYFKRLRGVRQWPEEGIKVTAEGKDNSGYVTFTILHVEGKNVRPESPECFALVVPFCQNSIKHELTELGWELVI